MRCEVLLFLLLLATALSACGTTSLAGEAAPPISATSLLRAAADEPTPDETDNDDEDKQKEDKQKEDEEKNDKPRDEKKADDDNKDDESKKAGEKKDDDKPADTDKKESKPADKKDTAKSADSDKSATKPAASKRKTLKLEAKRLKIDVTLEGAFVASKMTDVTLRPETWTAYEIVEVVPHGEKVRKGETLFKFDSEKLDEAIADLELEQRLTELAILKSDEEMPRMERTLKMDTEAAQRANQQAKEDFERYREIDRPMMEKTAEFVVKYYNASLNYEKDELEQLEKMYKADDLTEETEEIVLKRQRDSVELAEFNLESAKLNRDETLQVLLPRFDIRIKEMLERTAMAQARAELALSLDMNRARYELEQRKKARTKSLDRHAKLLKDRDLMEIKSPADGIVFYGQNVNGRWSDTATLISRYKPKSNVTAGSVLMTIVDSRPLFVLSSIDEGKRPDISAGQKAKIVLPAEDAERIAGEIKSISPIPVSPGKFEVKFDVKQDEIPDWIVPGMSCKVQITTYNKKDALVVPKTAVHDDEEDEDQKYVWLIDPDDEDAKPKRRNVKLGKRKASDVQIVKGLAVGDVISLDDESKKDDEEKKKAE